MTQSITSRARTGLLAVPIALFVGACLLSPVQQREETLVREARMFNDDLRWARYEELAKAMPPEEGPLFLGRVGAVGEDLALGDSDVVSITFGTPSETAVVVAKIEWYYKRDLVVKSTTLEQRWQLKSGRWSMVKQRRIRGDRFPLVTEPLATGAPAPPALRQ
jgi:hypothetical protein